MKFLKNFTKINKAILYMPDVKEEKKANIKALNTEQVNVIQDAEKNKSGKKKYLDQHFTDEFLNDYF